MSTLQTQGFVLSSTEDEMETDADRRAGQTEIVDIDLDLAEEQQQEKEDEYMSEDVTTFTHQEMGIMQTDVAYIDDEMVDDEVAEQDLVYEASIQDEVLQDAEQMITVEPDEDDEIIDIENNEPSPVPETKDISQHHQSTTNKDSNESHVEDQTFQSGPVQAIDIAQHSQLLSHEEDEIQNDDILEPPGEQDSESSTQQPPIIYSQTVKTQDLTDDSSLNPDSDSKQLGGISKPIVSSGVTEALLESIGDAPSDSRKARDHHLEEGDKTTPDLQAPDHRNESTSSSELPSASRSANDLEETDLVDHREDLSRTTKYVHPVVVIYQGNEISLFRPISGDQDFILEDESFANDSISNLLAGCRPVLGDDVDEQEMMIHVVDLDLHICEFGKIASTTTISQLTDIYLQLQHFDGNEDPLDLRLTLSTQPSSSHRLDALRKAVVDGKGLSQMKLPGSDQGDYWHCLKGQRSKYDDQNADSSVLGPVELGSQEQGNEDDNVTISRSKSYHIPAAPAVNNERVSQNDSQSTDVPNVAEQATDVTQKEQMTKDDFVFSSEDQDIEQLHLRDTATATVDASAESETQFQQGEEPVPPDDKEDLIDYEDEQIGSHSSSGSSTLHGDIETINQAHPSSGPAGASKEGAILETDESSHTLKESSNNLINQAAHTNLEADDLDTAEEGNESVKDSSELRAAENLEILENQDENFAKAEEENGDQFDDAEDILAKNISTHNDDHRHDNRPTTGGDYERSFKADTGEIKEDLSKELQYEDFVVDGEKDFIEDRVDLNQEEVYRQPGTQRLQEGKHYLKEQNDRDSDFVHVDEGLNASAMDEHPTFEDGFPDDPDLQAPLHHIADTEDNDEITYADEDEDGVDGSKLFMVKRDDVPSPGSLKRSRGHLDADNAAGEDLKDAKRSRST